MILLFFITPTSLFFTPTLKKKVKNNLLYKNTLLYQEKGVLSYFLISSIFDCYFCGSNKRHYENQQRTKIQHHHHYNFILN